MSFIVTSSFLSCEDLDIENENQPDKERALANPSDVESLMNGAASNIFSHLIGFTGIYFNLMADQTSTTNASNAFWSFADQPRLQINNSPTNSNLGAHVANNWTNLNSYIYSANTIIDLIEYQGLPQIINGEDKSDEMLITAYFVKGLAQGYISLIFDKAYIVNPDTDLASLEFVTYQQMNAEGIANIEHALSLLSSNPNYTYKVHSTYNMSASEFENVANSFIAKLMISLPRSKAEAANLDYNAILTYANQGITSTFDPLTDGGRQFFNNMQDWSTYTLSDNSGYLPTDIKVMRFLDPSLPADYPLDSNIILSDVTSVDPRADYFGYTTAFGYLRESRGRELFTNWKNNRFFTNNERGADPGLSTDIFHIEEMDYIKAEATWKVNGAVPAATILNTSARFTKGGITTPGTDSDIEYALHYEYSVELDLAATIGTQWFFMRRHDLLQEGTPLSYPVPGTELEITGDQLYSFGGENNAGQEGTADGSNSWKNN